MILLKKIAFLFLAMSLSMLGVGQSKEAYDLSLKMFERCEKLTTLSYEMTKTERIGKDYFTESFKTKINYEPLLIYSRKIEEGKSPELLFREGENENKALVNPDGFPWFNISLDPMGVFMRKNQHHTLFETGYKYALQILNHLFIKYGEDVSEMATMLESKGVNGRLCWMLEFNNKYFDYVPYTVKKDENVLDIAKKYMLSEFMIVEINDKVDDYQDVEEGQVISIPVDYSPRLIIAIDKERLVPISLKVYDEKGLFEQLEYNNVRVNPSFDPSEFTVDGEGYGF